MDTHYTVTMYPKYSITIEKHKSATTTQFTINLNSDIETEKVIEKNLIKLLNSSELISVNEKEKHNCFTPNWLNEKDFSSFNFLCALDKELLNDVDDPNYIMMKYKEVTTEDVDKFLGFRNLKYLNLHGCVFKGGSENNLKELLDQNEELFINTISTNIPIKFYRKLDLKYLLKFIFMEYSILKGSRAKDYLKFCLGNKSNIFSLSKLIGHYYIIEKFLFENNSLGDYCIFEEDYDWENDNNEEWDNDTILI
eukprot:TRINITY_DN1589_c0_g1_i1.p1 TRINITY_DN1589_c0_g1~~TRINITY_DN1589_c0_g1_i1.p1  ORF type:complete len:252 (+),score=32.31 TRINITY_DN1589_c0_g1_i1:12-767(+)